MASSDNFDVVYGPEDTINPVIFNLGQRKIVNLTVHIKQPDGTVLYTKTFPKIELPEGRTITRLPGFIPELISGDNIAFSGNYVVEYVTEELD